MFCGQRELDLIAVWEVLIPGTDAEEEITSRFSQHDEHATRQ